jgi:hypothetical protein
MLSRIREMKYGVKKLLSGKKKARPKPRLGGVARFRLG